MSIVPLYKTLGATPLEALNALRVAQPELAHEPMTYAGRLDPMAEGLLLVLTGEDRYRAKEFQQYDKTYSATFLLGFGSDTGDVLGTIVRDMDFSPPHALSCVQADDVRTTLIGMHDIVLPAYSSYKVLGKPLHFWAKQNRLREIEIPRRVMRVDDVRNVDVRAMSADIFLLQTLEKIARVSGDFRQEHSARCWREVLGDVERVALVSCVIDVGSGTYIRSLAHVVGEHFGTKALLAHLLRTRVGTYTV